jgi:hypothetical protein
LVGSVIHPAGNIAEALLKEGMVKCVDWSITKVTGGPEKYRAAEKSAKEGKSRIWKDKKNIPSHRHRLSDMSGKSANSSFQSLLEVEECKAWYSLWLPASGSVSSSSRRPVSSPSSSVGSNQSNQ